MSVLIRRAILSDRIPMIKISSKTKYAERFSLDKGLSGKNTFLANSNWVALVEDKIVGFVIIEDYFLDDDYSAIHILVVDREHRENGIGSDLLGKAVEESKFDKILLGVNKKNKKATSLYLKFNFEKYDEGIDNMGDDVIYMMLDRGKNNA